MSPHTHIIKAPCSTDIISHMPVNQDLSVVRITCESPSLRSQEPRASISQRVDDQLSLD